MLVTSPLICSSKIDFSTTAPIPACSSSTIFSTEFVSPELAATKGFFSFNPKYAVSKLLILICLKFRDKSSKKDLIQQLFFVFNLCLFLKFNLIIPFSENFAAYPYHGASFFNCNLVIIRHSH